MLVVACGAGVTAGTFLLHPEVKRIVICDIEPLVPTTVTPMFGKENYHVVDGIALENPHMVDGKQVEVVYDDGRHFLRTTREKFDIITSDPIDPWVKGCAALNTVEYYRMCRDHLNPGGIVSPLDAPGRKQHRDDQEPDRHLLRGLPQRHPLEQRARRLRLRRDPVRPGRADGDRRRRTANVGWSARTIGS